MVQRWTEDNPQQANVGTVLPSGRWRGERSTAVDGFANHFYPLAVDGTNASAYGYQVVPGILETGGLKQYR